MMQLTSTAFSSNADIPQKYTCEGADINPPLSISNVPVEAKSLVLVVDDYDSPSMRWVHWTVFNIDPKIKGVEEDSLPQNAIEGTNSFAKTSYGGPCPSAGPKVHRYSFQLYALDAVLNLRLGATRADIEKAMMGRVIAGAELIGLYSLKNKR